MAVLCLAWVSQGERLLVREREELRRAISATGALFNWHLIMSDQVETASGDVLKLCRVGVKILAEELAEELAYKRTEMPRLKRSAESFRKLEEEYDFEEPVEVNYSHTARKPSRGLVTKEQVATFTNAAEAAQVANMIETKTETWGKLRDEMVLVLKGQQQRIEDLKGVLVEFVASSERLIEHVFATLR